ncbi:MAG TPA: hypothetical protein VFE78_21485 [Gemmataceae bacterium]|jgi:hypothetical protein|nr:hypothetical protein [Gemmataceae bacterium]
MFSLLRKLLGAALLGAGAAVAGCMLNLRQKGRRFVPEALAPDDAVDDASDDSFPASDPPSRTAATGTGSTH